MAARLKLVIAYDGGPFAGWQSQPNGRAVQDEIEKVFRRLTSEKVRVHGAGRTDAGVHALGQCAHVDVPDGKRSPAEWLVVLNALLPPAIRVMRGRYVSPEFHARFSARGKVYRYRIWNDPILPPFEFGRAWHVRAPLDVARMKKAARLFVGKHDFAAFSANRGKPPATTSRILGRLRLGKTGRALNLEFQGDGFLYKMVRLIAGSLVRCGLGQISICDIADQLRTGRAAKTRLVAPADGLLLVRIVY